MLDIKWIRENPKLFDEALAKRGSNPLAMEILSIDQKRREHIAKMQISQERRNKISKEIGQALAEKNQEKAESLKNEVTNLKEFLATAEEEEKNLTASLEHYLSSLPNVPLDDVPVGKDEADNVEVRHFGIIKEFPFEAKEHYELGENLGYMSFDRAVNISGARFVFLSGPLAQLERAIGQFMLDIHTKEHGYQEMSVPLLVRDEAVFGTAQLPKFSEDLFQTTDGRWLIPTAEVPLTNFMNSEILPRENLPLRYTALTPCFRSEAGSAGRDTRGMLRQHQFWKVELVSLTEEEKSLEELERMTSCAEEILKRLDLPFRTMMLCTGDMGFAAKKTYDLEVWLPGQKAYREISSCSVCGDFQARRMNMRYRIEGEKNLRFVHSLNGSGTAVGRCLIAILENYQQEDGSIRIPDALLPYMHGMKVIEKR